jgi:hypothetical protein
MTCCHIAAVPISREKDVRVAFSWTRSNAWSPRPMAAYDPFEELKRLSPKPVLLTLLGLCVALVTTSGVGRGCVESR